VTPDGGQHRAVDAYEEGLTGSPRGTGWAGPDGEDVVERIGHAAWPVVAANVRSTAPASEQDVAPVRTGERRPAREARLAAADAPTVPS
jgi:hypothetical protein